MNPEVNAADPTRDLSVVHISNHTAGTASAAAEVVSIMSVFLFMTPASVTATTTVCRCLRAPTRYGCPTP